jgi:hypothetical protein
MRLVLSTALLVACLAGCGAPATESEDGGRRSGLSASAGPSDTDSGLPSVVSDPATTVPPLINQAVTRRARVALTRAGAEQLVETPGYEGEVNTAFAGVWRERPFRAYAVPTPDSGDGELTLVSTTVVDGHSVAVMQVADGAVRLLRFTRGPDTWLIASLAPNLVESDTPRSIALAASLLR